MATTDGIEVALRPVPSANVLIPYQITIPTLVGYATLVAKRVEIDTPGQAADRSAALRCAASQTDGSIAPPSPLLAIHLTGIRNCRPVRRSALPRTKHLVPRRSNFRPAS